MVMCSPFFARIHYLFLELTLNSLSSERIHFLSLESTIFLVNSLWMYCLFRKISLNLFSSLRILYGSIIVFRELTINSTFFHEFNINSFSLPQIQYIFTIFLANSLLRVKWPGISLVIFLFNEWLFVSTIQSNLNTW